MLADDRFRAIGDHGFHSLSCEIERFWIDVGVHWDGTSCMDRIRYDDACVSLDDDLLPRPDIESTQEGEKTFTTGGKQRHRGIEFFFERAS
jgi:hypothetical protein